MGYKPTENYAAKDFLESGDPDKIVMGKEIQADFDAISRAFTDTDNKLNNLDYVDLRGDTMTGPLSAPEVIADNFVGGDVSANVVKATGFEGNGSGITGIAIDQLTDVSAPNPQRDQVLTYNGSAWESVKLDIVDSDLTFKGPADLTSPVPGAIAGGDMYVSESSGTIDSSWTGLGGSTTAAGDFVAYSDADARWFNLGSVAGGAVTSVGAGSGIAVDALQPTAPVVSVDRSETDSWYADKSDTEDGLRDVNSALATTTLRVDRNETDISGLREDLTLETEARADGDAELLALIQAARPGSQVTVGDDAPDNPIEGDLWYCTLDGSQGLFVWHESAWLATDPEAGPVLWEACPDGTFFDGGSVGVNTDTPYSRFHVDGENTPEGGITLSSGANHHTNYLASDFVNVHDIESSSPGAAHTWAIDGDEKARIDADGNLTVDGNFTSVGIDDNATSTAITIDANENVGIGTDDPQAPLHVNATSTGNLLVRDAALAKSGLTGTALSSINEAASATTPLTLEGSEFSFVQANSERVVIDSSGNVGINAQIPSEKLQVGGNVLVGGEVESLASGTTAGFKWGQNTSNHYWKWAEFNNGTASLQNNSTASTASAIAVDLAGNVGIGTPDPQQTLHVDGGLQLSGFISTPASGTESAYIDYFNNNMRIWSRGTATTRGTFEFIQLENDGQNQQSPMVIDSSGTTTVTGGFEAAQPGAGTYAFAAGASAGLTSQGNNAVAVGNGAGQTSQGSSGVSIGYFAGNTSQGVYSVAVGLQAGEETQGNYATALGNYAGNVSQGTNAVAVGREAGKTTQGNSGVAIGYNAGAITQGVNATAIGFYAANNNQGSSGVALGSSAGRTDQGDSAVTIGNSAGYESQGIASVAIGKEAGRTNQGTNSIAIGNTAGKDNQGANGIIINSSGLVSNATPANHILLKSNVSSYLYYNGTDTWEFAGGTVTGGGLRFDSIVQDGAPVVDSLQIIRAFMKLRDAVDDPDSSVEELREKLKVAVVDIIDQFQDQIDTMPVPEEPSTLPAPEAPELGTMPTPETPSTLPAPERPKRRD